MRLGGYLPDCMSSLFATIISPPSNCVTVRFWDTQIGAERSGHISIQVGDNYFSAWANNTPQDREEGKPASMLYVDDFETDKRIVGHRIVSYTQGTRKDPNNPNSVDISAVPDTLVAISQLGEEEKKQREKLGRPSATVRLNSLNAKAIDEYLTSIKQRINQHGDIFWDQRGTGEGKFNCATAVWEGLKKGGIQNLLPSYGKMFGILGASASLITFPLLFNSWRFILAASLITTAASVSFGGMFNAQGSIDALFRITNANKPNGCVIFLAKIALWIIATLTSGFASVATLGIFDDVLKNVYITPDIVLSFVFTAKQKELSFYTIGPPSANGSETDALLDRANQLGC